MSSWKQLQPDRRTVLRGVLMGAGVAAVATNAPAALAATAEADAEKGSSNYRETDHIRQAYNAARF